MTRVLAGVGDMLQARSRRHIYWVARRLDRQSFPLSGYCLVDLLSLAQSADLDVFPFRLRPHLTHDLVSGVDAPFPAGRRP